MENNIEIPIYRTRKKYEESKSENYVIGYLCEYNKNEFFIQPQGFGDKVEIDPATLAINFPDMKDSKDNPIFASLSTSGKGGDILDCRTL